MFNTLELAITVEAQAILSSPEMKTLRAAYAIGESIEVLIMGRTIMYEPALLASGFTLSGEDSFILGPEAFSSEEELIKTLLHELFRLATSVVLETKTATTTQILAETNAAFEFAERAFKSLIGGEQ